MWLNLTAFWFALCAHVVIGDWKHDCDCQAWSIVGTARLVASVFVCTHGRVTASPR
jgi:hypothetical protein